jgi:hypothetical protein
MNLWVHRKHEVSASPSQTSQSAQRQVGLAKTKSQEHRLPCGDTFLVRVEKRLLSRPPSAL